jgi:hypothetical protein
MSQEPDESGNAPDAEPRPPTSGGLGLDEAWSELTGAGRGVVVGLALILLLAAAIGLGVAVSGGGGDGDGELVLAETSGDVVTLEVPPPTAAAPETTFDPVETGDPLTATDPTLTLDPSATATSGVDTDAGPSLSGATYSFTEADGPELGAVTIVSTSDLEWTSDGSSFVLVDDASGATLVDSLDPAGAVALEAGDYDLRVEADGGWTIVIRPT